MIGISADAPVHLRAFRTELSLSFVLLSDPDLASAEALGVPISTRKNYHAALLLHPELREYPRAAFLQPALFIWRGTTLVHEWRQTETLINLWGARNRPSPDDILRLTRDAAAVKA